MEVHQTTHTKVGKDQTLANTEARGHYTKLDIISAGQLSDHSDLLRRPEYILVQKATRQFYRKKTLLCLHWS